MTPVHVHRILDFQHSMLILARQWQQGRPKLTMFQPSRYVCSAPGAARVVESLHWHRQVVELARKCETGNLFDSVRAFRNLSRALSGASLSFWFPFPDRRVPGSSCLPGIRTAIRFARTCLLLPLSRLRRCFRVGKTVSSGRRGVSKRPTRKRPARRRTGKLECEQCCVALFHVRSRRRDKA